MSICEKTALCAPFFKDKPGIAMVYKKHYCFSNHSKCARYRVAVARLPVPLDLFPCQESAADYLLMTNKEVWFPQTRDIEQ